MGPRERRGLVAVLVALVLGVVVVEVLGRGDRSVDGVVFGSLFFIAALAYGLASGALAEITGPGGLGVKFSEAAQGKVGDVATVSGTPIEPTDLEIVAKGPLGALEALRERLREGKPIALTLQLGSGGYRGADVITYTRVLMSHDPGLLVVFVDPSGRFVGSTLGVKLLAAMGDGDSGGAQGPPFLGRSATAASTRWPS